MLKYLLIFVLLVGAAFGVPPIRAKIMPPLLPILDKLGPIGDAFSNPTKKWAARNEVNVLIRKLAVEYADKKELPSPLRFTVWVRMNTKMGNKGMDPWGRPYYMVRADRLLTVGSNGPDMQRGSADDVRVSVPFQ